MRYSRFFLLPVSFYLVLWGISPFLFSIASYSLRSDTKMQQEETQLQLQLIDDQIRELEEKKKGYLAKALRHQDQAERLQFRQEWFLEAKRHMELADENLQAAAMIQVEIDRLKKRRDQILEKNGAGDGFEDL